MIIPCYNPCRTCPGDPDFPFVNLSSEEPDVDRFIGRRFNPPYWPPIGDLFFAIGCLGYCVSTVSQEDADLCAELQAMECLPPFWPRVNPNFPPPTINRTLFYNTAQSCSFNCPDGTPFTFTLAAGLIAAFNQLAADTAAHSYACNQAVLKRICLMALTPSLTCTEAGYVGSVAASTDFPPLTFTIEGDLPPGLVPSSNETTLFITGVPTTPGDFTFSVHAADRFGNGMTKPCALTCFGIVNESPLPDAEVGTPYSVTLFTAGTVTGAVTYSVTVGSLPDGLTLNSATGEISGTPTTEGPVSFTVRATSESIACSKGFGIQVEATGCIDWSQQVWDAASIFTQDGGTASWTPSSAPGETFVATATCTAVATSEGSAGNFVFNTPFIYNGPQCDCKVTITIANAPIGSPLFQVGYVQVDDLTTPALLFFEPVFSDRAPGVYEFFFSIPDTGGLPKQIMASGTASVAGSDEGAKAVSITATFDTA